MNKSKLELIHKDMAEIKHFFAEGIDFEGWQYTRQINRLDRNYINLDFKHFFNRFPDAKDLILEHPSDAITELETIISYLNISSIPKKIIFHNIITEKIKISDIKDQFIDKLVSVTATVLNKSQIYASLVKVHYECSVCSKRFLKEVSQCDECYSKKIIDKPFFNDVISLLVEENQLDIDNTQRTQSIYAHLPTHLIDRHLEIYPGARITLYCIPYLKKNKEVYNYHLKIHNFEVVKDDISSIELTTEDVDLIKSEVLKGDFLKKISESLFNDIYGLEKIKESIVLQLIGSPKEKSGKFLRNRGNLMILLVGSPGTSKSVILKKIASFFPRSRYASCSMASSIGLVASTRKDEISGTYIVEPGAIPLCHQGGCAVTDELDKIRKEDLGHLNTLMDSLKIVVDKANVHADLPCDVSILAAMNPRNKVFELNDEFYKQVNLPKDFLDRFDLVFCLDSINSREMQDKITDKVLSSLKELDKIYDDDFILKYISYCRSIEPKLTLEAKQYIKETYNHLTNQSAKEEGARFSTRLLTNFVRVAGAYSRSRLSDKIELIDCQKAFDLILHSLKSLNIVKEHQGQITFDVLVSEDIAPKTIRDKMKCIRNIIGDKIIEIEQIKEQLDFDDLDELIDKMKRDGQLFEPKRGMVKLL